MNRRVISVLVVDDHPLVREHLGRAIDADARLRLVGAIGDGAEAPCLIEELRPDAMVVEVELLPGSTAPACCGGCARGACRPAC